MMPVKEASQWFDEIAPKNPLIGSRAGENTNSIMVQIGRRLTVEEILEELEKSADFANGEYSYYIENGLIKY